MALLALVLYEKPHWRDLFVGSFFFPMQDRELVSFHQHMREMNKRINKEAKYKELTTKNIKKAREAFNNKFKEELIQSVRVTKNQNEKLFYVDLKNSILWDEFSISERRNIIKSMEENLRNIGKNNFSSAENRKMELDDLANHEFLAEKMKVDLTIFKNRFNPFYRIYLILLVFTPITPLGDWWDGKEVKLTSLKYRFYWSLSNINVLPDLQTLDFGYMVLKRINFLINNRIDETVRQKFGKMALTCLLPAYSKNISIEKEAYYREEFSEWLNSVIF